MTNYTGMDAFTSCTVAGKLEPSKEIHCLLDKILDLVGFPHIHIDVFDVASFGSQCAGQALPQLGLNISDHDTCTGGRKLFDCGAADPRSAASDQGDFPGKVVLNHCLS